jgi:hypothetical protein
MTGDLNDDLSKVSTYEQPFEQPSLQNTQNGPIGLTDLNSTMKQREGQIRVTEERLLKLEKMYKELSLLE